MVHMETILVVDDEAEVLAIAREMLEEQGYRVLGALNAEEAVRASSTHSGPIDLLLTDIVMPGTSGHDLAQQLSFLRSGMKVLYMTAFTLAQGQRQFSEAESGLDIDAPTILKPFTSERLAEKVQEVLATKARSPFDRPSDPWRNV